MVALIEALQQAWPEPIDLAPSTIQPPFADADRLFVEAVHGLLEDGLATVEALLVGAGPEPVAQAALLTRKGATVLYHVTRPM